MIATLLITILAASSPANPAAEQPALQCDIGPTTKRVGDNDWLVYGCADGRSVVVIAATPNPAAPFVFIVAPDGHGGIELHGEGTGAKSATDPAYAILQAMTASDLATLFQRAHQAGGR